MKFKALGYKLILPSASFLFVQTILKGGVIRMALPKEAPKTNLNPTRVEITSDGTQVAYGRVVPWYLRRKGDTQIPNLISEQDFKEKFPDHL